MRRMVNYLDLLNLVKGASSRPFNVGNLHFYVTKQLFPDTDFRDKKVLDIGGGSGLLSFYAALNGARDVVVLEPEFDGSYSGMIKEFELIRNLAGGIKNINMISSTLQEFRSLDKFDIVLSHNSINHIDEEACENIINDVAARRRYEGYFSMISMLCAPGSTLIICDCARSNFFYRVGIRNPFGPNIEWPKHQDPDTWAEIAGSVGFHTPHIRWSTLNRLRGIGTVFMRNKLAAYFTRSHFRLEMRRS